MKAILKFDLPEDEYQFSAASRATKWVAAMWEMDQWLRSQIKYTESYTDDQYELLEDVREKLRDIMNDNNVSFDE